MSTTIRAKFFLLLLSLPFIISAQVDIVDYAIYGNPIRDSARELIPTSDGNLIMVSYVQESVYEVFGTIRKVTPELDVIWETEINQRSRSYLATIIETDDNGFLVVGSEDNSTFDFRESRDVHVIKLDSEGEILWERTHGGEFTEFGRDILPTPDGGYIFVCDTRSFDKNGMALPDFGEFNTWISRLDEQGNEMWNLFYDNGDFEVTEHLIQAQNGKYLLCGGTYAPDSVMPHPEIEAFVIQFTADGEIEWETTFGGTGDDVIRRITQDQDGNIYCAGFSSATGIDINGNNGEIDWLMAKLDQNGNLLWTQNIGGPERDFANDLLLTEDGNILVVGDNDLAGGDFSTNEGAVDVSIALLNKDGNVLWIDNLGGDVDDEVERIEVLNGRTYIYGRSSSSEGDIISISGEEDLFLMEVNIEKNVVSQNSIELTAREIENGNISLVWNHSMDNDAHQTIIERSCDLNQWEEIISLPYGSEVKQFKDSKPCNGMNYYRLKLKDLNNNYNFSEVEVANINFAEITVYPNPVSSQEEVNITSSGKEDLQVLIMDQSGKIAYKALLSQKLLLSSSDYPSGSYYVLIFRNDNLISKSLLVIE